MQEGQLHNRNIWDLVDKFHSKFLLLLLLLAKCPVALDKSQLTEAFLYYRRKGRGWAEYFYQGQP